MDFSLPAAGSFGAGLNSVAFGTVINQLIPGKRGCFTYLTFFRYTCAGTAHVVTAMRSASDGKVTTAVVAGGTSVIVDTALTDGGGNAIAANDWIAVELDDRSWHLSTISGWTAGTKTMVLNTAVPTGRSIVVGAKLVCFGVAGDAYQSVNAVTTPTSVTTNYPAVASAPILRSRTRFDPILLQSSNVTATGTLEECNAIYSRVG